MMMILIILIIFKVTCQEFKYANGTCCYNVTKIKNQTSNQMTIEFKEKVN
jgi:hypothetical protein